MLLALGIRIENQNITGFDIGEESLMDFNLQDIQLSHPYEIKIQKFNRRQEAKNGADWEWWFISNGLGIGFRVQAKKISMENNLYPDVDRTNKYGRQVDLLIDGAENAVPPRIPLYVFYNYVDTSKVNLPWNCSSFDVDLQKLGSSLVDARFLRTMNISKIGIEDIKGIMLPWHCLICCSTYIENSDVKLGRGTLPYRALGFINNRLLRESDDSIIIDDNKINVSWSRESDRYITPIR